MQLQVKTILNRVQRCVGFVYRDVRLHCRQGRPQSIEITVEPHGGIRRRCSRCQRPAPGYDCLPERRWRFVPLWGIPTYFCDEPRRVECAEHGVVVEHIPWSDGKRLVTCTIMGFLARWARRMSWRETARAFQTSWEAVYRSVEWLVEWGLAHRELRGVGDLSFRPKPIQDQRLVHAQHYGRRGGAQQQNPSGYQTILRLPHLRGHGNYRLSHVGTTSGTRITP